MESATLCSRRSPEADPRHRLFRSILASACLLVVAARLTSAATLTEQLDKAIEEGNQQRFESLLAQVTHPNAKTETTTPLLCEAAYFGREKMFEALLAKGAD